MIAMTELDLDQAETFIVVCLSFIVFVLMVCMTYVVFRR
jgi:hypothetical protein